LSSISANTKISATLFEALERGDLSRWPSGIFRKSFIRAYATAIGLDPDEIAREFLEQYPDPLDPAPAVAAPQPGAPKPVVAAASAAPVSAPRLSAVARKWTAAVEARPSHAAAAPKPTGATSVRVKVAETPTPFVRGQLLDGIRPRLAAVACDAGVVVAIALLMFVTFDKFWLPLGVSMLAYYLGGILLLGNTPGVCLLAPDHRSTPRYNPPFDAPRPDPSPSPERAHPAWHLRMPAR
jgi:hypothetical protein